MCTGAAASDIPQGSDAVWRWWEVSYSKSLNPPMQQIRPSP
jgi:hypothetical protein